MAVVWYSRRPEVAELAKRSTMARAERFRQLARDLEAAPGGQQILDTATGIPLMYVLNSIAEELEVRLSGGQVVDLAPNEVCPDPTRCFEL